MCAGRGGIVEPMGLDDLYGQINARGFGTRSNARNAEVSDSAFSRHAATVGLTKVRKDLWVPGGTDLTHDHRIDAALEALGDELLITGASGLYFERILDAPPETAELLVPAWRNLQNWPGTCRHRTAVFDAVRAHHIGGRPVASVPRCYADHAQHVSVDRLCQDMSAGIRMRRCTVSTLATELGLRKRWPGRGRYSRAIVALSKETTHSGDERLARRLLHREGLRCHREPLTIENGGAPIAEIDIAFPDLLLGIEIDGPHHLLPHVAAADRQRDRQLERLGWRIERFYWFEVEERRAWFVAQVLRIVEERSAEPTAR